MTQTITAPPAEDLWAAPLVEPGIGPAVGTGSGNGGGRQRAAARPAARVDRPAYKLTTRKPRRGQAWPFVLLAGGEFSGKTTAAARFASSGRFGRSWLLPFGEDPDLYADLAPDIDVANHDGSLFEFAAALDAIEAEVNAKPLVDGKPQLVVIDSGSILWDLFTLIAEGRARKSDEAKADLMRNPYSTVNIGPLNWSAVGRMWHRIIRQLRTMQAVTVMTARGKDGIVVNGQGKIDEGAAKRGEKTFRVEVQSETPYAASAFVRLDRALPPQVLGIRMGSRGLRPGIDEPIICDGKPRRRGERMIAYPEFNLEWLIFDLMRFDPATAYSPTIVDPDAGEESPDQAPVPAFLLPPGADEAPGQAAPAEVTPTPPVAG